MGLKKQGSKDVYPSRAQAWVINKVMKITRLLIVRILKIYNKKLDTCLELTVIATP